MKKYFLLTISFLFAPSIHTDDAPEIEYMALKDCCRHGDLYMVKHYLEKGTHVNRLPDSWEEQRLEATPLYYACDRGHLAIAQELIKAGAHVDDPARDDLDTPLLITIYALCRRHEPNAFDAYFSIVRLLIEHHADVRKGDKRGKTPLMEAVWGSYGLKDQQLLVIQYLVDQGAPVNQTNSEGETALDYIIKHQDYFQTLSAWYERHSEIIQYLESKGAVRGSQLPK